MLTAHHVNAFLRDRRLRAGVGRGVLARRRGARARRSRNCSRWRRRCSSPRSRSACCCSSDHKRAADHLHYAYGTFALLAVLSPWLYAPSEPRARLLWFAVATLVAAALGVRAWMTA